MTTDVHKDVLAFHNTFGVKDVWLDTGRIDHQVMNFREELIREEQDRELLPAIAKFTDAPTIENLVEVADGLVDTVYVVLGAVIALDLPWEELWNEVQRSNMAKVWPDGTVKHRDDGKILKPSNWTPPDLHSILLQWQEARVLRTQQSIGSYEQITPEQQKALIGQWQSSGVAPTMRWDEGTASYVPIDR